MTVIYDWVPERLDAYPEKDGFQNVVFTVFWRVNASDGAYEATTSGTQEIALDPEGDFTPFEQLSREQVMGWVKDAMGHSKIIEIETYLAKQIANQITPPVSSPDLPWNK